MTIAVSKDSFVVPPAQGEFVRLIATMRKTFDPNQKRDELGQWAKEGGGSHNDELSAPLKKLQDFIHVILHGSEEEKQKLARSFFHVADTPQFMKELGPKGDYFSVRYGVIARHSTKDDEHNLSEADWLYVCDKIIDPIAITKYNDGFRLWIAMKSGNNLAVGVDVKNADRGLEVNAIKTVFEMLRKKEFSKNAHVIYMKKALNSGHFWADSISANIPPYKAFVGSPASDHAISIPQSGEKASIKKSMNGRQPMQLFIAKTQANKKMVFNAIKQNILRHLDELEEKENAEVKKCFFEMILTKGGKGYPVGTVRTWKGKKFVKTAPNKWKPKYDGETHGSKMAISALKKKIAACDDAHDMMMIMLSNRERFSDKDGHPLPFVQDLSRFIDETQDELERERKNHEMDKYFWLRAKNNKDIGKYKKRIFDYETKTIGRCKKYIEDRKKSLAMYQEVIANPSSEAQKKNAEKSIQHIKSELREGKKKLAQLQGDGGGSGGGGDDGGDPLDDENTYSKLTPKQKENLNKISAILKNNVEPMPEKIPFTKENFDTLFKDGITTPIEKVKIGENQYAKLKEKNREGLLAAMADVLSDPAVIIKTIDKAKLYVKTYKGNTKEKNVVSVVIDKENISVSISTHIERNLQLAKKMDSILFERTESVHGETPHGEKSPTNTTIPQSAEKSSPQEEFEAVKKRYKGTDKWLKAPNGEKTKLTERQWLQVRTPSFKAWFGDWENDPANASKVVDENGEPMVVYHYSYAKDIQTFIPNKADYSAKNKAIYFTNSKKNSKTYGDILYSVYLNIKNPNILDAAGSHFNDDYGYSQILDATNTDKSEADGAIVEKIIDVKEPKDKGEIANTYIVFSPNQIKSASDNEGAFDPQSDDIRKAIIDAVAIIKARNEANRLALLEASRELFRRLQKGA